MKRHFVGACLAAVSLGAEPVQASSFDFALGKALFDRPWTSAPASTQATDGLGPLFNARSCVACHAKGGRGDIVQQPDGTIGGLGYVLRVGRADGSADPIYGRQLQTNAIHGYKAEGHVLFQDNKFALTGLSYGALSLDTRVAGRLSQPLLGLGLLEQVSDQTLFELQDPEDADGDGISGRVHVLGTDQDGQPIVGRFAWKATAPSLMVQAANAFANDIGMSTPIHNDHWGDCTEQQTDCRQGPSGASPQFENLEIDSKMLALVTHYLKGLPAPTPKEQHAEGKAKFVDIGCASCHLPALPLPNGKTVAAYTDLLLHDMGPDLSDGIREGNAAPNEWRTQPLWGTAKAIARKQRFLHDARAGSVEEAILWHGGEAEKAKNRFKSLNEQDKKSLIQFLENL